MFTKILLKKQLSRKAVGDVHRYLFDFGQGAHRVFWVGEQACLETDCTTDVTLLWQKFPGMVEADLKTPSHSFAC
ncbi:MAG: hypothetical protein IKD58_08450 [Loktanella sp.]|nr:hypothetical protein [Loktanella sp.]